MTPKELRLKNWVSIQEIKYSFENGAWQVKGKNHDEPDQDPNGSGKSAFQDGISKCILDCTEREERDKEMVRHGEKQAELYYSIYCPIRKELLEIERIVKRSGSSTAQITIGGEVKVSHQDKAVKQANSLILEWLDISKEDLQSFYIISSDKNNFFTQKNAGRIEMINRFSGAAYAENALLKVKKESSIKGMEIVTQQRKVDVINGKIEGKEEDLEVEKERDVKTEIAEKITALKNSKKIKQESIADFEKTVADFTAKIIIQNMNLSTYEHNSKIWASYKQNYDISSLNDTLDQIEEKRALFKREITELKNSKQESDDMVDECIEMIRKIENSLAGLITCPKCSHEFMLGNEEVNVEIERSKVNELNEILTISSEDSETKKKKISEYFDTYLKPFDEEEEEINKQIILLKKKSLRLDNLLLSYKAFQKRRQNDLKSIQDDIDYANKRISSIKDEIILIDIDIEELNNKPAENERIKEINETLSELREEFKIEENTLNTLKEEQNNLNLWAENFKKFKIHLAKRSIKAIENKCNKYLKEMQSDIRISIEGFKEKADGTFKEEITPYFLRDGIMRVFGSFSKGERGKIMYAGVFAFQEIINSLSKYGGLDFLAADEAINGLGANSLDTVCKSMKNLGFPIYITSHIQSNYNIERCIMFEKRNGISNLITDVEYLKQLL